MIRNRLTALSLVLGVAALGTACDQDQQELGETSAVTEEMAPAPATTVPEELASGDFEEPEGTTVDVDGEFDLRSDPSGGTVLNVQLEGLTPGEHAWHIHSGECGQDAPVAIAFTPTTDLQPIAGAQALQVGADGRAAAMVNIPSSEWERLHGAQMDATVPDPEMTQKYSIHVHQQGGTEHGPTVACANLDVSRVYPTTTPAAPTY